MYLLLVCHSTEIYLQSDGTSAIKWVTLHGNQIYSLAAACIFVGSLFVFCGRQKIIFTGKMFSITTII